MPSAPKPRRLDEFGEPIPTIVSGKDPQLTVAYIDAMAIRAERYMRSFELGFTIRVEPQGTKFFLYYYKLAGKPKRGMVLGEYGARQRDGLMPPGTIGLKDAKVLHLAAMRLVKEQKDPQDEAKEEKEKAVVEQKAIETARGKTLREVFIDFQTRRLKFKHHGRNGGRKDNGAAMRAEFEKHIFPTLGDLPLREVRRPMVQRILDGSTASTAYHLFCDLTQFLDWAVREEEIDKSPYTGYTKVEVVGTPEEGKRALIDWEITRFYRQLPVVGLHEVTKLALRFMLATGQRSENVCGLPKSELSKDGAMWSIAKGRYKGGKHGFDVPLSKHAQAILQEAARFNQGSAFVFPSARNPNRPITERGVSQALRKKQGKPRGIDEQPDDGKFSLEKFTPHDFKRSCRTGLARIGYDNSFARIVIGHALSGMDRVYNRHDYAAERAAAFEKWGEHIDTLK